MNRRLEVFNSFKDHAWLSRSFVRLSKADLKLCIEFLEANASLSKDELAPIIVRLFMDRLDKPKRWKEIEELLLCSNSAI